MSLGTTINWGILGTGKIAGFFASDFDLVPGARLVAIGSRDTATPVDPEGRVFSGELGGGALLQKGIYLLSLASMILGAPKAVQSCTLLGEYGSGRTRRLSTEVCRAADGLA